jgi:hypothetical protein
MRRSIAASEKSIALQEIPYRQWVDFTNWRTDIGRQIGAGDILYIEFDVLNSTKFPLKFLQITLSIGKESIDHKEPVTLNPGIPVARQFSISLTADQRYQWLNGVLKLTIVGTYLYIDQLWRKIPDGFLGILTCNKDIAEFQYRGLPSERIERGP